MGISWQEYGSRLPFPTPEASSRPRDGKWIPCVSLHWQVGSLPLHQLDIHGWTSLPAPLFLLLSPSSINNLSETPLENLCNIIRDSFQACCSFLVMSVFVYQIICSYDTGYVPEPWETVFRWAVGLSGSQPRMRSAQHSQGQPTLSFIPQTLRMLPSPPPICPTHREYGYNPVYAEEA